MKRQTVLGLVFAFVIGVGAARADDKANPTGTWKWKVTRQGQEREVTLKLKLDGDKLTGSVPGRDNTEIAIGDGKIKDGTISFTVTRERGGVKSTTKYSGKITGDTIKGTIESERNGEVQKRDWEAKRDKSV